MAEHNRKGALALIGAGVVALLAGTCLVGEARAAEEAVKRPAAAAPAKGRAAARPRVARTAAADKPLLIRRRPAPGPYDVVGTGFYGDDYLVRQHAWNDPRLYYFGPFRTGGEVMYGDQAGNPITRGNAGLGEVAGYGAARGGFGGPHFDAVGGFHQGPGPDFKTDNDYATGSLSRPDYGVMEPRYPSVSQRVAHLDAGAVSRAPNVSSASTDRAESRRVMSEGRTGASFAQAKADFAAPMKRQAPIEAGFANGGINSIGIGDDAF